MIHFKIYDIPNSEIDGAIRWLKSISNDCELRIRELTALKNSKDQNKNRSRRYRVMMNDLAKEMYYEHKNIFDKPENERTKYIQEKLECDKERAQHVYDILLRWAQNKRKADRNKEILLLANTGMSKTKIAKKYNISRTQIYDIIKKEIVPFD